MDHQWKPTHTSPIPFEPRKRKYQEADKTAAPTHSQKEKSTPPEQTQSMSDAEFLEGLYEEVERQTLEEKRREKARLRIQDPVEREIQRRIDEHEVAFGNYSEDKRKIIKDQMRPSVSEEVNEKAAWLEADKIRRSVEKEKFQYGLVVGAGSTVLVALFIQAVIVLLR